MAGDGDRSQFELLVMPHVDAAYNLARHLLREEADARDVVQESLMKAWQYFATFRGTAALPWLLQIVRNTALTLMRRRTTQQPISEDWLEDQVGDATEVTAEVIARADGEAVRNAVAQLPPIFREVIVLRELEGLSYKEIATVTGVSLGTVMSRISRARRHLQTSLAGLTGKESHHDL